MNLSTEPMLNKPSALSHSWNQLWGLTGDPHVKPENELHWWKVCPSAHDT